MLLVVTALLVAVAVGRALGGRLDRLGALPLRGLWLLPAGLAAQVVGALVGGPVYPLGLAASALLVGAFLLRNRGVRGTGLVALGLLSNALVVGANGAMPVGAGAAGRAGVNTLRVADGLDARHELRDSRTRLPLLSDVVPVPLPGRPEVVSPGDVLVAAGLAQLVVLGMGPGRYRARRLATAGSPRRVQPLTADRTPPATSRTTCPPTEEPMAKKGRKRRARKKSAANHGKRPNA